MIVADTKDLEASLAKAILTIERKLKNMVEGFAYEFTLTAALNTPLGNADDNPENIKLFNMYQRRTYDSGWQSYGLEPKEGFARGAWQVSLDGSLSIQELYGKNTAYEARDIAKRSMQSYQLGQTVIIGNYGPYIQSLENNHSAQTMDQGIMKPTIEQVLTSYRIDLQRYYSEG